ncbi:hypothetical protein RRG08_045065 [Elysia crispata]|uniref:Uncharacterized protein n=1 Tax=Elysia crispata TaxID=231223 RepID=A0AAE0YGX2_9GAST|nr:hypothetical protein RRG08_045065 [Elysia crispata]
MSVCRRFEMDSESKCRHVADKWRLKYCIRSELDRATDLWRSWTGSGCPTHLLVAAPNLWNSQHNSVAADVRWEKLRS